MVKPALIEIFFFFIDKNFYIFTFSQSKVWLNFKACLDNWVSWWIQFDIINMFLDSRFKLSFRLPHIMHRNLYSRFYELLLWVDKFLFLTLTKLFRLFRYLYPILNSDLSKTDFFWKRWRYMGSEIFYILC